MFGTVRIYLYICVIPWFACICLAQLYKYVYILAMYTQICSHVYVQDLCMVVLDVQYIIWRTAFILQSAWMHSPVR